MSDNLTNLEQHELRSLLECREQTMQICVNANMCQCKYVSMKICVGFTTKQKIIERAIISQTSSDMNFGFFWNVESEQCKYVSMQICVDENMCWL